MSKTKRITQLEADLAKLQSEQADLVREHARTEVERWQARIDDLEVQVHLGAMEAKTKAQPLMDQLRLTWDSSRHQVADVGSTATEVAAALKKSLADSVESVRAALLSGKSDVKAAAKPAAKPVKKA